jgi:hypothetical protein
LAAQELAGAGEGVGEGDGEGEGEGDLALTQHLTLAFPGHKPLLDVPPEQEVAQEPLTAAQAANLALGQTQQRLEAPPGHRPEWKVPPEQEVVQTPDLAMHAEPVAAATFTAKQLISTRHERSNPSKAESFIMVRKEKETSTKFDE